MRYFVSKLVNKVECNAFMQKRWGGFVVASVMMLFCGLYILLEIPQIKPCDIVSNLLFVAIMSIAWGGLFNLFEAGRKDGK